METPNEKKWRLKADQLVRDMEIMDKAFKARIQELGEENQMLQEGYEESEDKCLELRKALLEHRADLHCYSSRPCPTCRQSAEVLGIAGKVPDSCAKGIWDEKALKEGEDVLQNNEYTSADMV